MAGVRKLRTFAVGSANGRYLTLFYPSRRVSVREYSARSGGVPLSKLQTRQFDPERAFGRRKEAVSARLWRLPKQATPKRRPDFASQSLLKTIVLRLEDYFLGAIAPLMSHDAAGRARLSGSCGS